MLGPELEKHCRTPAAVGWGPLGAALSSQVALVVKDLADEAGGIRVSVPASSVLGREGAGCGSVGDMTGAWLASAPLSPSLWT